MLPDDDDGDAYKNVHHHQFRHGRFQMLKWNYIL